MPSGHVAPKEVIPMHPQSSTSPLETWKSVLGYEGWYEVSDLGNVRSVRRTKGTWPGRVLKPHLSGRGYLTVRLYRESRVIDFCIHRLVLAAFVGPFGPDQEGNHINGVKTDNRVGNLEKVSPSQNTRHALQSGLCNPQRLCGSQKSNAKLTEDVVRQIRALGDQFSQRELARRFGIHRRTIQGILHRRYWQHV
jgi:hypothetical protein